ncbi:HEPN domain-containing protein, partial [Okeania hirsuta]
MPNTPDTYGRSIQLGASRRRLEDARVLHSQKRWNGAIYMGGYAVECALKSLICYQEPTNNFK